MVEDCVFIQIAFTVSLNSERIEDDYVIGRRIGEVTMGYASGHYDRETAVLPSVVQLP